MGESQFQRLEKKLSTQSTLCPFSFQPPKHTVKFGCYRILKNTFFEKESFVNRHCIFSKSECGCLFVNSGSGRVSPYINKGFLGSRKGFHHMVSNIYEEGTKEGYKIDRHCIYNVQSTCSSVFEGWLVYVDS